MSKRYEIVSQGGVLSTVPPVAVVWVEGAFPAAKEPPAEVEIAQRNFVFEPSLLAVRTGTTIAFPNYDSEYHNVFSYSKAKRFDLGRYMPEETPVPTQTFDTAGTVVLRCDIHEHMKAIIIVVDSPHYITTDTKGHFRIDDLEPGNYTLKAWVNSKSTLELPIVIAPDEKTVRVSFP